MLTMPPAAPSLDDARWQAVASRSLPDDVAPFVFAVATTGVFCRPGCASRLPRRENVRYFATTAEAEAAAFRPCKRCTPTASNDAAWPAIERALAAIDDDGAPPSLASLAADAGFSRAHFHRTFVRLFGLTPKRYLALGRAERLRARLQAGPRESVLDASLASGYTSSTPRVAGAASLGMTPGAVRAGGRGVTVRVGAERSSLGFVAAAVTERGVCAVEIDDDERAAVERVASRYPGALLVRDAALDEVLGSLVRSIDRGEPARVPLDVAGTAFARRVWDELMRIEIGTTVSYGELATRLGAPKAARAVARACASNVAAIAIPCHRVVRSDGELGGYRFGVERKARLLARERATPS